jgi:hypothetical protein
VVLTTEDRVAAIAEFGFSERQARFLELVLRHAGVCVPRQYASFAGIANGGDKCNAFFDKLIRRGYAVPCDCIHNRARLYRVHCRPLYRAIGEVESRYRRPVPAARAVERVMLLDAVLGSPNLNWLTSDAERVAYLATLNAAASATNTFDAQTTTQSPRRVAAFFNAFPIGIDTSGRAVLLYLVTVPWTDEFRTFVQAQSAFLRSVPAWALRLVFPRPLDRAYDSYQRVIHEELDAPLQPATIAELKWHFEHRQKAIGSSNSAPTQALLDRAEVFNTPRFTPLYRRWLKHGDTAFETLSSPVLGEALANGTGRIECLVLPHSYRHLSPLASLVRSTPKGVEKGEREGEHVPPRPQPVPSPPPPASLSIAEQLERDWYRLVGRS